MSQAVTQYSVVYDAMASRRVRPIVPQGIDLITGRVGTLWRSRKRGLGFLKAEAESTAALGAEYRGMSEAALDDAIARTREVFVRGRLTEEDVRRGLAAVREVARRDTGEEAYVVQLMGALGLFYGRIIEMLTGEGKTLTGSIAAPLMAWRHKHLHVFTVNDYLATRDAQSRKGIYERCLLDVGAITQEVEPNERTAIYSRAIIYGTPKQIVADWLRDQIRMGKANTPWAARFQSVLLGGEASDNAAGGAPMGPMVPGLQAAMVDEADAVLIDEGVVPLIIARSRREDDMAQVYREAASIALKLDEGPDFEVQHVRRRVELKRRGQDRAKQFYRELLDRGGNAIWRAERRAEELVKQALVARYCYIHGRQYQIVEGKVVIVDEYTGRFLQDRTWEHGLHQSVEAKEGLDVTADRETLARLSFQRFFRSYPFLCGMTGTAADAVGELESVYARPVTVIPTNRPIARITMPMRCFRTARDKWAAIVASIEEIHNAGRPVLVGTRSIASSEMMGRLLEQRKLPHQVLNANFDKEEATLITQAGRGGAAAMITVATNMAGRGTDIKLEKNAHAAGGLHVILTEMHGAKRIDRQFIGRAGRQGDPGSSQLFVSLEDELLTRYLPLAAKALRGRNRRQELTGTPGLDRLFRLAQQRCEAKERNNRAAVLKQDDWIEKHLPGS